MIQEILYKTNRLLAVTKRQAIYLANSDIPKYLELLDQRDELIGFLKEHLDSLPDKKQITVLLNQVIELDNQNAEKLNSLMNSTKSELDSIPTTKSALYSYIGKNTIIRPEARFIDKEK